MPYYAGINGNSAAGKQISTGLLRLKDGLDAAGIPPRRVGDNLLLATWNIREFGPSKQGLRDWEPLHYIAEIIDRFDLVAVQEVRGDLLLLERLMRLLGGWWKYLITDVTEGSRGNGERMAFLYDARKLAFGGLAGEIVLPPTKKSAAAAAADAADAVAGDDGGGAVGSKYLAADQLARTPYLVGFKGGWFKFTLCTTHVLYGTAEALDPERIQEIRALAKFLAARAKEKHAFARNMILLGDFNIFRPQDVTMTAITEAGFLVPAQLQTLPSNVARNKHYDQIAFLAPDVQDKLALSKAGVFNVYEHVYRLEDEALHAKAMGEDYLEKKDGKARDAKARTTYYKDWRTFQMSDHLPMWIELATDFSRPYLEKKRAGTAPPPPPDGTGPLPPT
jgi:endonuclease/exonuclease/phosphatase family metal-dependent hydrolase